MAIGSILLVKVLIFVASEFFLENCTSNLYYLIRSRSSKFYSIVGIACSLEKHQRGNMPELWKGEIWEKDPFTDKIDDYGGGLIPAYHCTTEVNLSSRKLLIFL